MMLAANLIMIAAYFALFGLAFAAVFAVRGELGHRSMRKDLSGFHQLRPSTSGRFTFLVLCGVSAAMAGFLLSGGWPQEGAITKNVVAIAVALASAVWAHDVHEQLYGRLVAWSPEAIILRDAGGEVRVNLCDLVAVRSPPYSTRAALLFSGNRELEFERYLGNAEALLTAAR